MIYEVCLQILSVLSKCEIICFLFFCCNIVQGKIQKFEKNVFI